MRRATPNMSKPVEPNEEGVIIVRGVYLIDDVKDELAERGAARRPKFEEGF
jgi:hypothetical protein